MLRLPWPVAVSGVMLACSHAPQTGPPGRPVTPSRRLAPMSQATWRAKFAFDSAARAGDVARLTASFSEDALLITANGDSIRGRNAIVQYIVQRVPEAISAGFVFARDGTLKRCVGGALEHLLYTAYIQYPRRSAEPLPGSVSVLWNRDANGNLKVTWAAQVAPGGRRNLERSLCHSVRDSISQAWRYSVNLFPAAAVASTESQGGFEALLRTRGWDDATCSCYGPTRPTPSSNWSWLVPPSLVGIQYRVDRRVIAEVIGGRLPQGSTLGAREFSNRDHEEARLSYSGVFVAALFSYKVLGFHVGIGPAVQRTHWTLTDSLRPSGGFPSFVRVSQTNLPVGIVADVKYQALLIEDRTLFIVRGQLRRFPKARTPATANFPPAAIGQGSSFIGAGFGVVF